MKILITALALFFLSSGICQSDFSAKEVLGHDIGSDFSRHSQVVEFFEKLNEAYPNNSKLETYGTTTEGRRLQLFYIGSESTLSNLQEIRKNHLSLSESEKMPIVWLSYNVHGNESSGTEAAMKTALTLLRDKKKWLENVLVIMDPCLNPDGRDRYINFFKQYASTMNNSNVNALEHQEPWPGGRFNHYLFDLNRDWAWLTQVESKQRIKKYNKWLPHVHVDFHEQGINENYYFPPAAEPYHEIVTDWQRKFQEYIGENHSKYFDANNWLYFSKEIFDLLYPSYGDTYPMYNGSIGMTYEQAGSGHAGRSVVIKNGDTLSLYDRVEHHVAAGLSTVEVAIENRNDLIREFQEFNVSIPYRYKSYILSGDEYKIKSIIELLELHDIKVSSAEANTNIKGWSFNSQKRTSYMTGDQDIVVSVDQIKGPLVKVLFEPVTFLSDSLTYDITAWSLPYAYGLDAFACEDLVSTVPLQKNNPQNTSETKGAFAYVCRWNSMESARFLQKLLASNVNVRYAEKSFKIEGRIYEPGTLVIIKGENSDQDIDSIIVKAAKNLFIDIKTCSSGYVEKGNDFGSSSYKEIKAPSIGMIAGEGLSPRNTGEIWYFFEQVMSTPFMMFRPDDLLNNQNLENIDILFLPEGQLSSELISVIDDWVQHGGRLIVFGDAAKNFQEVFGIGVKEQGEEFGLLSEREELSLMITGAIYDCDIETKHPLSFGYTNYHTLRQNASHYFLNSGVPVFSLPENAHQVSGFVGSKVRDEQGEALIAGEEKQGKGSVTYFIDNPLFRGFWNNGLLMVANAIYLVND